MTSPADFTRSTIAAHMKREAVADTDCFADMRADSLDLIEIAMKIEEHYSIDLEDSAFADSKTVGDAVAAVENAVLANVARGRGDALAGEAA